MFTVVWSAEESRTVELQGTFQQRIVSSLEEVYLRGHLGGVSIVELCFSAACVLSAFEW